MAVVDKVALENAWGRLSLPLSTLGSSKFADSIPFIVGVALIMHQVVRRYEPKTSAQMLVVAFLPPFILSKLFTTTTEFLPTLSILPFALNYILCLSTYATALLLSILIYRLSPWHPLATYPGPLVLRTSKLAIMWYTRHGNLYTYIRGLHDKYGDYIRVGPNEISTRNVEAVLPVLGATGLPKGPLYDGRTPAVKVTEDRSLISLRDTKTHMERRKLWNKGFTSAALKDYEQIVIRRGKQLAQALDARKDGVDIAMWLGYFTFDFMGDMAFGGGFELMRDQGDKEGVWTIIKEGLHVVHLNSHAPWISRLAHDFTTLNNKLIKLRAFSASWAKKRIAEGSFSADLWHHLFEVDSSSEKHTLGRMASEAQLAIIAGSDTTATTLANVCYFICRYPEYLVRLQAEIDQVFPDFQEPFDSLKLSHMPLLNAVINEALRLQPPVPSGGPRSVPVEESGRLIGTHYVPTQTQIFVHIYTLHRDPRYFFPHPDSFWPDRWLPESDRRYPASLFGPNARPVDINASAILNHTAFVPFSFGPQNCVGKSLATVEMRMIISLLFQKFDMRFAKGYDTGRFLREQKDLFVMDIGQLDVELTPRT